MTGGATSMLALLATAATVATAAAADTPPVPPCRCDGSRAAIVAETIARARGALAAAGTELPFDAVRVNPSAGAPSARTLDVFVVRDALESEVGDDGCPRRAGRADSGSLPDALSVRGGCVVLAADRMEIRCSTRAVEIFSAMGERPGRANPALLYVLAHELAHLAQRQRGEFVGPTAVVELGSDTADKLTLLRAACAPAFTRREERADAVSLEVLSRLLLVPPYREPLFSERGSLYWNIDQLAIAADAWQSAGAVDQAGDPRVHPAFVATEFPTPVSTVAANARRFVCDALQGRHGAIRYPTGVRSHPPMPQRLRRIAEKLKPQADALPATGAVQDFASVARLQEEVSPILAHIYREEGVYLEAVQKRICAIVNSEDPQSACR